MRKLAPDYSSIEINTNARHNSNNINGGEDFTAIFTNAEHRKRRDQTKRHS